MGPTSRAAIIKHQRALQETLGAIVEELQGIRSALNEVNGRTALDIESLAQRQDKTDERLSALERSRPA